MRLNVLQHVSDEGPGAILNWANDHQATVTIYHPNDFGLLPTVDETDLLVVLGSPASPNDDDQWIKDCLLYTSCVVTANRNSPRSTPKCPLPNQKKFKQWPKG